MIVKNLTRKSGSGQLLKYIFKYMHQEKHEKTAPFVIRHNVESRDVKGFVKEFKANAKRRKNVRKNQTAIHHTILSWSNKDSHLTTPEMVKRIAKRYIELRGETNLYVGTIHTDRDHLHLHLAMSGNQINGLSSRISKSDFANLKIKLDSYQQEQFPELVNSLPHHGKAKDLAIEKASIIDQEIPLTNNIEPELTPKEAVEVIIEKSPDELELETILAIRKNAAVNLTREFSLEL